jgi:hypothetical protein
VGVKYTKGFAITLLVLALACLGPGSFNAWAQANAGGTLNVTVLDPSGALIPNAQLELKDQATNDIRRATTQANGAYSFPNLPYGFYQLTVSAQGFQTQVFNSVQIQTGRETDVNATLKVGTTNETVTVEATETPLVQTESSTLAATIDTKQIVNLPLAGRDAWSLVYLTPGWVSTGNRSSSGTFNNLPGGAIGSVDFDGTPGMSNRFRSSGYGYGYSVVQARIENIAEMTVQTAQLDLSGNGTAATSIKIVSRRGSNEFHGRLYEDFRNTVLNSNSWINNARGNARPITKFNEFGGSVGGPIMKDKLFFFGTWAERKNPNTSIPSISVMNPLAQQGIYQYRDSSGNIKQVDLFAAARAAGLPGAVNPQIASQLQAINGVLGQGNVTPSSDPNLSTFTFTNPSSTTVYYPTLRLDYNATDKLRFNFSYTQNKTKSPKTYAPNYPGLDTVDNSSYEGNNRIAGFGIDYTIKPTLINQFSVGFLYQYSIWDPENKGLDLPNIHAEGWGMGTSIWGGSYPRTAISSYYPQWNLRDSLSWQRGEHSFVFGGSWFREQDHYWNGPGGWPIYYMNSLNGSDPAYAAINNAMPGVATNLQSAARALYATLTARISSVSIAVGRPLDMKTKQYKDFGQYNLNEVQQSGGFWAQDRWRVRPNLTLNYGIRWDIVGNNYDKDGAYSSAKTPADLWGPTPIGAMFQPGVLGGVGEPTFVARKHVYKTSWVNPQPAIAIAWNPKAESGILGKLIGTDKTVIRTGYSLRNYQEGAQNFWAFASNSGAFFYQSGSIVADPSATGPGYFKPGTLTMGDPLPAWRLNPATWAPEVKGTQMFGSSFYTMNPEIRQPYVQQWNFGIQRTLPGGNALEVRYVGNLTLHSWLGLNLNEINIFENGFLDEFKNAQNNLAINRANGKGNTPFNYGLPGQVALPIMTAALGATNNSNWTGQVTNLDTGAAGSMARTLAGTTGYLCSVIGGTNFAPCAAAGYPGAGLGKPLNFWGINPYARTAGLNYLDAAGHSNYHGLQVEFRQRPTHGMQFSANYTWAHSLGLAAVNNLQSQGVNPYTLRNLDLNYGPSSLDIRHTFRVNGTYDLPFGKGKTFLSGAGRAVDSIVGGWTIGMITVMQSGNPAWISGGYSTVTGADSGVNFVGITAADFQKGISIRKTGNPWVLTFDPQYIGADGMASSTYFTPATTPGVFGAINTVLRAPMWWNTDLSVTKIIPITERVKMSLQGSALNAFNHPTFGIGSLNIRSTSFGQATSGSSRSIELRANIEF